MNKKGFTLIELLAVIVVLGVVLLLAMPSILDSINASRDSSYKILIGNIKTAAETYYQECEYGDLSDKNKYGNDYNRFDYFIAENELTSGVFRQKDSFDYQGEILKIGMPRNDILINSDANQIMCLKEYLGLNHDVNVLIYAPTFREDINNAPFNIDFGRLIDSLQTKFGGKWVVLFRYHHMQKGRIYLQDSIDVTLYPDMQELLLISDILITDYSSCMWDFSLMDKPVFLYAEDVEKYIMHERGEFYYPLEKLPFSISKNNDELNEKISEFDKDEYVSKVSKYHQVWGRYNMNGDSTKLFVEKILN